MPMKKGPYTAIINLDLNILGMTRPNQLIDYFAHLCKNEEDLINKIHSNIYKNIVGDRIK